jgi:hypothetical protein
VGVFDALTCSIRVSHFIAQNARNHTDPDSPDRHTALNPRALAVQADVLDRFLCFDSPQLHQPDHDGRPEISGLPVDSGSVTGNVCVALPSGELEGGLALYSAGTLGGESQWFAVS